MSTPDKQRAQAKEAAIDAHDEIAGRPAEPPNPQSVALGYEVSDADFGPVFRGIVGVIIFTVVSFFVVTGFQWFLTGQLGSFTLPEEGVANAPRNPVPTIIQSRAATGVESHELRALELEQLSTYGWVNEEEGVVRIPVQRAMELLVEEGLPTRTEVDVEDLYQWPLDSSSGRMMERTTP